MKKNYLLTLVNLLLSYCSISAQPYFNWAAGLREPGSNTYGIHLVTDTNGNIYTSGNFQGSITFDGTGDGGITLNATGTGVNTYLVKYNKYGKVLWADKVVTAVNVNTRCEHVAIGADGNIYFSGTSGNVLGSTQNSWVAKYKPDGSLIWNKTFGNGCLAIKYITPYNDGFLIGGDYKTSNVDISPQAGIQSLPGSTSYQSTYIAYYDTALNVSWSSSIGNSTSLYKIAVDPINNVPYVCQSIVVSPFFNDIEICKINPTNGNRLASVQYSNIYNIYTYPSISFDSNGYVYFGLSTSTNFDADPGPSAALVIPNSSQNDIVIIKYDDGLIYQQHYFTNSPQSETLQDMVISSDDELYISGGYLGTPTFSLTGSGSAVTNNGDWDGYIANYNLTNLALNWVKTIGGTSYDIIDRINVLSDKTINFNGIYRGTDTDFDFGAETFNLPNPLGSPLDDMFLSQWTPNCQANIAYQPSASSKCLGNNVTISFGVTGSGKTYRWYKNNQLVATSNSSNYSFTYNASNVGIYHCEVSNNCGPNITSDQIDLSTPFSINSSTLNQGLLVYLPFNGNVNDGSTFNRTVSSFGNPSYAADRHGRAQGAINFDGIDDYLQLPADVYFGNTTEFSLSTWIYLRGNTNPITYGRIFDFGNGAPNDNVAWLSGFNNNQKENLVVILGTSSTTNRVESGDVALTLNTWIHLVATYKNGTVKLYRNGIEVASGTVPSPNNVVRNLCYIGKSNWGSDPLSYMRLDEFRIYNRQISDQEINALYNFVEFTQHPSSVSSCNSSAPIQLTAKVTGNNNYFDWIKDGVSLGVNNDTLYIASPTAADNGTYVLTATNGCYKAESNPAIISQVTIPPTINSLSQNAISVCENSNFNISVDANNGSTYWWYNDAGNLLATTASPIISSNQFSGSSDSIYVIVENACGIASSQKIPVEIKPLAAIGSVSNVSVCPGEPINVTVQIDNATSVVWEKDLASFTPTTENSLVINNATATDAGLYSITASNSCNTVSNSFLITVKAQPTFNIQPPAGYYTSNDTTYKCSNASPVFNLNTSNVSNYVVYKNSGSGFNVLSSCSSGCNNWSSGGNTGQFYFVMTSPQGCQAITDTFVIENISPITTGSFNTSPTDGCLGTDIEVNALGFSSNVPLNYKYNVYLNWNLVLTDTSNNPSITYTPTQAGYYSIVAFIDNGCDLNNQTLNFNIQDFQTYTVNIVPTVHEYCVSGTASTGCFEISVSANINPNTLQYSSSGFNTAPAGPFYCGTGNNYSFMVSNESGMIYVTYDLTGKCASAESSVTDSIEIIARDLPNPVITENAGTLEVLNGPYNTYTWTEANNPSTVLSNAATFEPNVSGNYGVMVTNQYGCSKFYGWYYFIYTGLDKLNTYSGIKAYPNPFNGQLTVEVGKEIKWIEIIDATGKQVEKLTSVQLGANTINTYNFSNGIYLVKVIDASGSEQLIKVTKQ